MMPVLAAAVLALAVQSPGEPQARPEQAGRPAVHMAASFEQISQAAKLAREGNRDEEAIGLYKQALKIRPDWTEGLWYRSTLLYGRENYFEACETLRRFLGREPGVGYGWALLGMSEFQTREYSNALNHLELGMKLGISDQKKMSDAVYYLTAILLTRFEQYDNGIGLLFSIAAAGGDTTALIEPIGLAALRLPLLPGEIPADRREMIRLAGTASLALQAQQFAEAEKQFRAMEAAYPKEPGVHFLIGAYLLSVRPEEGIREMEEEIELSPSHALARTRMADQYVKEGKFDEAMTQSRQALRLAPKDASAHLVMGEVLLAKGDGAAGIKELETARGLSPEMVRVRWDLVKAYSDAGRSEDADREKIEIKKLSSTEKRQNP